jgi:hypothetical protein
MDKLVNQFSNLNTNKQHHQQHSKMDMDTLCHNDTGRRLFNQFLKEYNNSDNLLTLYLICGCFHRNQKIDNRQRIKQVLEKTYTACFVKNQMPYLSKDLKQKLCETLQKSTYNESVFMAVQKEIKHVLEQEYYPLFLKSKLYKENFLSAVAAASGPGSNQSTSSLKSKLSQSTTSSSSMNEIIHLQGKNTNY